MIIRPVEKRDVNGLVELVRTTLAEFGIAFGQGAATDDQLRDLPESYSSEGGAFFVAVDGESVIGTAGVALIEPAVFELRKMYLSPTTRGRGLGQQLFDACLKHVVNKGGKRIVLDTTEDDHRDRLLRAQRLRAR